MFIADHEIARTGPPNAAHVSMVRRSVVAPLLYVFCLSGEKQVRRVSQSYPRLTVLFGRRIDACVIFTSSRPVLTIMLGVFITVHYLCQRGAGKVRSPCACAGYGCTWRCRVVGPAGGRGQQVGIDRRALDV